MEPPLSPFRTDTAALPSLPSLSFTSGIPSFFFPLTDGCCSLANSGLFFFLLPVRRFGLVCPSAFFFFSVRLGGWQAVLFFFLFFGCFFFCSFACGGSAQALFFSGNCALCPFSFSFILRLCD